MSEAWGKIISFESLYKAHRVARLGKRHKKEVIEFETLLGENLWSLHFDLKYNKYKVGGYHKFMIYDPKEREIQAITYRDRIIQHSLCDNYLTPLLEKHFYMIMPLVDVIKALILQLKGYVSLCMILKENMVLMVISLKLISKSILIISTIMF